MDHHHLNSISISTAATSQPPPLSIHSGGVCAVVLNNVSLCKATRHWHFGIAVRYADAEETFFCILCVVTCTCCVARVLINYSINYIENASSSGDDKVNRPVSQALQTQYTTLFDVVHEGRARFYRFGQQTTSR